MVAGLTGTGNDIVAEIYGFPGQYAMTGGKYVR